MCYFHLVRVVHPFTVMMEDNGDGFLVAETCWGFSTFKMKKLLHLSLFFFMDLYDQIEIYGFVCQQSQWFNPSNFWKSHLSYPSKPMKK